MISTLFGHLQKKNSSQNEENTRGNAMIYILLAIALFGILTATLSGQNADSDGQDIDDEMVEFYANELLEYSAAAKSVVDQMLITGSTIDDLNFVNPTSAGFDTPPHIHKVFHPEGGGLTYQYTFSENIFGDVPSNLNYYNGWFINTLGNVEWTPSTQTDIILSALRIRRDVCEKINEKITGSQTTPALNTNNYSIFQENFYTTDLTTTSCSGCDGYVTLCVENSAGTYWSLYTILAAR